MIGLDGEKMSKSRGNLVFVSKLRGAGVDPMALRLALLDGHYRSDREWTGGRLPAAERRLARWRAGVARVVSTAWRNQCSIWSVTGSPTTSTQPGPSLRSTGGPLISQARMPTQTHQHWSRDLVDALLGVRL